MFRFLLIFLFVFLFDAALASEPGAKWHHKWDVNVWNTYCELRLTYDMPQTSRGQDMGFLSEKPIERLFIRFTVSTRTHFDLITEDKLFKVHFNVMFYGNDRYLHPISEEIFAVTIGGMKMTAWPKNSHSDYILGLRLEESDTSNLLRRFSDNEIVEMEVLFKDGDTRSSKIFPSGDRDFHVWASMFKTCEKQNIDENFR